MAKGLGIAALVLSILAIFVPVITIFVVWLAMILAAVGGFFGERAFAIASVLVSLVNLILLSPMTWAAFAGENAGGGAFFQTVTVILFIAPIVAMIVGAKKQRKAHAVG